MSLPAAATSVAVLVLAWDERTPAVRALVEATEIAEPVLDSVVVLVPAGPATKELTQEEFLPLEPAPEVLAAALLAPVLPVAEPAEAPLSTPTTEPSTAATSVEAPAAAPTVVSRPLAPSAELAPPNIALAAQPIAPAPLAVPMLVWQAVRVLRLSNYSLPELAGQAHQSLPALAWTGNTLGPTAPYLGSTQAVQKPTSTSATDFLTSAPTGTVIYQPELETALSPTLPATEPTGNSLPAAPLLDRTATGPPVYLTDEPAALDAEADTATGPPAEEPFAATDLPAATATEEPFATIFAPAQSSWSQALASLQEPASAENYTSPASAATELEPTNLAEPIGQPEATATSSAELAAPLAHPALRPAPSHFEAPNLNFQIIQYARFAVPLALAEQPFGVIYAPAWPTWLAAQELRYRTGRPLVLHVATLAASDTESVETATGWPAELQRQVLHLADLILAETPALTQRLRHELNLPANLVRTVPAADSVAVAQALQTARTRPTTNLG